MPEAASEALGHPLPKAGQGTFRSRKGGMNEPRPALQAEDYGGNRSFLD
jgi:hypothetical protein